MREHFETPIASKLLLSFLCTIFFGIPLAVHAHDDFPEDAFTDPPPTHLPIDHPDRIRKPEYQHVHEYYQVNNTHPPNLIRITAWWTVEPQNWQSSDPDTPNQIGNLQNFKNDDLGNKWRRQFAEIRERRFREQWRRQFAEQSAAAPHHRRAKDAHL